MFITLLRWAPRFADLGQPSGETTPLGKCLLCKHKFPSSIPSIHIKSWVWWNVLRIPALEGRDRKMELTGSPPSLIRESQVPERSLVSQTREWLLRNDTWGRSLDSTHTDIYICVYPHRQVHQNVCVYRHSHTINKLISYLRWPSVVNSFRFASISSQGWAPLPVAPTVTRWDSCNRMSLPQIPLFD